jgi:hypothetical protein
MIVRSHLLIDRKIIGLLIQLTRKSVSQLFFIKIILIILKFFYVNLV